MLIFGKSDLGAGNVVTVNVISIMVVFFLFVLT